MIYSSLTYTLCSQRPERAKPLLSHWARQQRKAQQHRRCAAGRCCGGYGTDAGFPHLQKAPFYETMAKGKVQDSEEDMNMFWVGFLTCLLSKARHQRYKGGEMTRHELGMHLQLLNPEPIMTGPIIGSLGGPLVGGRTLATSGKPWNVVGWR